MKAYRYHAALIVLALVSSLVAGRELPNCNRPMHASLQALGVLHDADAQKGVDDDLIGEIRRRTGCAIEASTLPLNRSLQMLEAGALDMQFACADLPARRQYGFFAFYGAVKNYALVRNESKVTTLEQFMALPELKIGIVRGGSYGPAYDKLIHQLRASGRIFEASDSDQAYDWFAARRVDVLIAQNIVYPAKLRELKLEGRAQIFDWTPEEPAVKGGLLLSKRHFTEQDAIAWQNLFDDMRRDGTLLRILRKYMREEEAQVFLRY